MTEQQWLKSTNLYEILRMSQVNDRQRRLFAIACCRHVQHLTSNTRDIGVIGVIERYIDGNASANELDFYRQLLVLPVGDNVSRNITTAIYHAAYFAESTARYVAEAVAYAAIYCQYASGKDGQIERKWQFNTLRHIAGNPFQPKPVINVPNNIKQLAHALYEGQPCHFALHDALIDANYPDLADHFKDAYHPKGCHVLDLICTR